MRKKLLSILALLCLTVSSAWAETTVTFTNSDIKGASWDWDELCSYVTKDGVTLKSDYNMAEDDHINGLTFSTSVGKFTRIVITADDVDVSGGVWDEEW